MITAQDKQDILDLIHKEIQDGEFFKVDRGRIRATLVSELWVGGGNTTFRANREGVFAGATNYTNAPFKLSYDGSLVATNSTLTGTLTSGDDTGKKVIIDGSSGIIKFYYTGSLKGSIFSSTSGYIEIDANSQFFVDAGGNIQLTSGNDIILSASSKAYIEANGAIFLDYNYDGGSDAVLFYNNSTLYAYLDDSGTFWAYGDIYAGGNLLADGGVSISGDIAAGGDIVAFGKVQCGSEFKSSDGSTGQTSTGFDFITHVDVPNEKEYYHSFDFKDGIVTDIGSEHSRDAT